MDEDFTIDELYNLIKIEEGVPCCGIDEVLCLLAEYIGDKRVEREVNKYVDGFYEMVGVRGEKDE